MSRTLRLLAPCLLLLSTAGCAGPDPRAAYGRREISVVAEGWAPLVDGDTPSARRRALAEAQKKAVEKAVGVTVRARTRVDDAVNVKQSIEANLGGTIRRYEVTSEGEEGGFFKVRIRAVVIYQEMKPDLPERSASRLSIHISSEKAAGAVRSALSSRDYELLDDDARADVAVTGVVETRGLADPRLGGFYSYTAKVSLTAANLRSGKVTRFESEASSVDLDEHAACDRALEKAGDDAGAALASSLSERLEPMQAALLPGMSPL
ncbi:MAG: hypothetical protein ACHQ2Z_08495 [Elusimicrobiota bacterium]